MMTSDATPHNKNRIDHSPPANTVPHPGTSRKTNAGRWHRRQQQSLAPAPEEPLETDDDTEIRRSIKQRAIAEALMLLMFRLVWALNLAGSIVVLVLVGRQMSGVMLAAGLTPLRDRDYAWIAVGWQLFCTHIEQHLWKTGETYTGSVREQARAFWADMDKTKLSLVVFFGVTDALPTAWLILRGSAYMWDTIPYAVPYLVGAVVATLMAMTAEPLMKKHRRAMRRLFAELNYNVRWI